MLKEEREDPDMKQQMEAFRTFVEDVAQKYDIESFTLNQKRTGGEDGGRKRQRTGDPGESVVAIAVRHTYTNR
jgi:hypothetical protein